VGVLRQREAAQGRREGNGNGDGIVINIEAVG
jgi:hypothetical protein